ncbi:unnamed protein product, partial [Discosporangium mesarthrocarpum]
MAGKRARPWGRSCIPVGATLAFTISGMTTSTFALTPPCLELTWSSGGYLVFGQRRAGDSRRSRGKSSSWEGGGAALIRTMNSERTVVCAAAYVTEAGTVSIPQTVTNTAESAGHDNESPYEPPPPPNGSEHGSRKRVRASVWGEGGGYGCSAEGTGHRWAPPASRRWWSCRGTSGLYSVGATKNREYANVRMFLLERGLSQRDLRHVLNVIKSDPKLVSDVEVLAARMQAISGLLEGPAASCSNEVR